MGETGDKARAAALKAMVAVTEEQALLSDALPRATDGLPPEGVARAGRLATETLRWANRSDRLLGPHLRLRPEDPVMHALRMALFELYEDGAAAHGVVNDAVSLVTRSKSGLVNGVLRNVIRAEPDWTALPYPEMPKWLRKPLIQAWGKSAVLLMERVQAARPPLDLTLKSPGEAAHWARRLSAHHLPNGSLRLAARQQVTALEGYEDGAWWVQDAGASLASAALAVRPGERVLDLCAAPGGKTMQLAALGAEVTALDISETRMKRVSENLVRTGLAAETVIADALDWEPDALFNAILLDAPCSATGTLRRHPDLMFAKNAEVISDLTGLQAKLVDRAAGWVKPGGRLVYCTCSLLPEEGEGQVSRFLNDRPDFRAVPIIASDPKWAGEAGLRVRPDHWHDIGGIDGFFIARLEKRS